MKRAHQKKKKKKKEKTKMQAQPKSSLSNAQLVWTAFFSGRSAFVFNFCGFCALFIELANTKLAKSTLKLGHIVLFIYLKIILL